MTNEEIVKRLKFELEIGIIKPFTNSSDKVTITAFEWSKDEDKNNVDFIKLSSLLVILNEQLGYTLNQEINQRTYCNNMDGISVDLTRKTYWFFIYECDEEKDEVNELPDYLLEYEAPLIENVKGLYDSLERIMYGYDGKRKYHYDERRYY